MQQIAGLWQQYSGVFISGLLGTLWLSAVSVGAATVIGTFLAMMKMSRIRPLGWIVDLYLLILRGTPILLQLYFFWLLLPKVLPIRITDTQSIIVALVVNASSYVIEIIRSGIQAVDVGQREAAKSLGLSDFNTMKSVILPQAIKNILPALGNQYIMMVKQASLASIFFISELMTSYRVVQSATFLALPSLIIAGVIYLVLTTVMTEALKLFERRLRRSERSASAY